MNETIEDERQRLTSAWLVEELSTATAALDEMEAQRQYDLVLDVLVDWRQEVSEHAAAIAARLFDEPSLDLSQLPAALPFSAYWGAAWRSEIQAAAEAKGEDGAGLLASFWPRIEGRLRTLTVEEFLSRAERTFGPDHARALWESGNVSRSGLSSDVNANATSGRETPSWS